MGRTNIDIDDELVARVMAKFHLNTKKAAVDLALQRLVGAPLQGEELADYLLSFEGSGWNVDLEQLSSDAVEEIG